jgi:hypothetical protein
LICQACFIAGSTHASHTIRLGEQSSLVYTTNFPYEIFIDSLNQADVEHCNQHPELFSVSTIRKPKLRAGYNHWIKMRFLRSENNQVPFVLEFYDFKIDSITVYWFLHDSLIQRESQGDQMPFETKPIAHKNFSFIIPPHPLDTLVLLVKIRSSHTDDYISVIKSLPYFSQYSNAEYFSLGLFYGILVFVFFFNLVRLFTKKKIAHIFYCLYVLAYACFSFSLDGLGFQYLWPEIPQINNLVTAISLCAATCAQLLFNYSFHQSYHFPTSLKPWLVTILCLRIIHLMVVVFWFPEWKFLIILEVPYFLFMIYISIENIKRKNIASLYYISGISFFLLGFTINSFRAFGWIKGSLFTLYSPNIGVTFEMFCFIFGLAYQSKLSLIEKITKEEVLLQKKLRQSELESAIKSAAAKVDRKNKLIQKINLELETFIYKSYHNLRGPISTLKGLFMLPAQTEHQQQTIIDHATRTTDLLEQDIVMISKVSEITHHSIQLERMDLTHLVLSFFPEAPIRLNGAYQDFFVQGDRQLLTEGVGYVRIITDRLKKSPEAEITIQLQKIENTIECLWRIPNDSLLEKNIRLFFTPYNIDLKFLHQLNHEPYLVNCVMHRLRGDIFISRYDGNYLDLRVRSKLI